MAVHAPGDARLEPIGPQQDESGGSRISELNGMIEGAVGLACMAAGAGLWRRSGLRVVAILLAVAGLVAVVHAAGAMI